MITEDALKQIVSKVLYRYWDPIGVYGQSGAEDEYDSYAAVLLVLLRQNATPDELAQELSRMAEREMGLTGLPHERHRAVSFVLAREAEIAQKEAADAQA